MISWILDSSATNIMTFDSMLLSLHISHSSITYINVIEGSHALVVGSGNLQSSFMLQFVFHVLTYFSTI